MARVTRKPTAIPRTPVIARQGLNRGIVVTDYHSAAHFTGGRCCICGHVLEIGQPITATRHPQGGWAGRGWCHRTCGEVHSRS